MLLGRPALTLACAESLTAGHVAAGIAAVLVVVAAVVEVEVEVVSVTAVVFDKSGHFVRGLGTKDVELLENGVKQEVSYFREASSQGDAAEHVPLSVVLVLDTSGSMTNSLKLVKNGAGWIRRSHSLAARPLAVPASRNWRINCCTQPMPIWMWPWPFITRCRWSVKPFAASSA